MKIKEQQRNKQRESLAFFRNQQLEVSGTLHISTADYYNETEHTYHTTTYTLQDPLFWNPHTQSWQQLTKQSLSYSHSNPELARSEFFKRLYSYFSRRFNQYVHLTIKSTIHE